MRRILYTGTRAPSRFAADLLHVPMLAVSFHEIDESTVRAFTERPTTFVFYSRNGVRALRRTTRLLDELPGGVELWAVGERTAEELRSVGLESRSPEDQRFAGLLTELPPGRHVSFEIVDGDRSLAEHRPDDEVLTVHAYSTGPANIGNALDGVDPLDWIVFTSPRGFESFKGRPELGRWLESSQLAAIGPTTAEAMTEAGHPPAVIANEPDSDALVERLLSIDVRG